MQMENMKLCKSKFNIDSLRKCKYKYWSMPNFQRFVNLFQINDSFVPVSCLWVFRFLELRCWLQHTCTPVHSSIFRFRLKTQ